MFTKLVLYPYKMASGSARALSNALRLKNIRTKRVRANGNYRARPNHLIVNWGSTCMPQWMRFFALRDMLNPIQFVINASFKDRTLAVLRAAEIDCGFDFTSDSAVARGWLENPCYSRKLNAVVCRTLTRANSGRGIVLARTPDEVVPAPLYTRYKPKQSEYRVHVFANTGVVDVQEKRKVNGFTEAEGTNKYIRNHPNGWVFCRENVEVPSEVCALAERAVLALSLDFGAVDIGWHPEFGYGLYEINTAPGLEGQTLDTYASQLQRYIRN